MVQGIIECPAPTRASGFVLFNSLGEWLKVHWEIVPLIACLFGYQQTQQAATVVQSLQKK